MTTTSSDRPNRRWAGIAAATALVVVAAMLPALGQTTERDEVTGVIRGAGASALALAVPPTEAGSGVRLTHAAEIGQILRSDLEYSGWFGLLDPQGEGRIAAGQLDDPQEWRRVGAQYLVLTRLSAAGNRSRLNVRVLETSGGTVLMDKTWGGSLPDDIRRLAHAASDAVVEDLTGRPGIAQTFIAFVSRRGEAKEVYLMDYDGARVRRLTSTDTINLSPAWSPDSSELAFLSYKGRTPSIYLLSRTGEVTTLRPRGGELNAAPDFSPDASKLAFSSDRDGNSEIYTYDLASDRETRLTRHAAIDTAPVWSPSGREIAFTSDRSGTPQIYIMSADGSNVRRLTYEGRYNESAAWSPDGNRIAFVSRISGRFEIVIHDLGTGRETVITSGPGNKENPRWAPDARHLVFSSNRDGRYAIYTIRDDGTQLRRLTRGTPSFTPDWSPISGARAR